MIYLYTGLEDSEVDESIRKEIFLFSVKQLDHGTLINSVIKGLMVYLLYYRKLKNL